MFLPAIVVIFPNKLIFRILEFKESEIYTFPSVSTARPTGSLSIALVAGIESPLYPKRFGIPMDITIL